jgi:Icc-related predicted phosphoesterase
MPLFGKSRAACKLFFATDVHGSERTWRKFINAGKFYGADVLVMGGDIIGKLAIPIIRESDGGFRATVQGRVEHFATEADLKGLLDRLGTLGFYSKVMDDEEFHALQTDPSAVDALFHTLARERLNAWVQLAQERLAGTGIRCFITGGNDDYSDVLAVLPRGGDGPVQACEGDVVPVDDHNTMASLGISTPTPWHTPREVTEEELAEVIARLMVERTQGPVVVVADSSKWGVVSNFEIAPLDRVQLLVSDDALPPAAAAGLTEAGLHVVLAGADPDSSPRRAVTEGEGREGPDGFP